MKQFLSKTGIALAAVTFAFSGLSSLAQVNQGEMTNLRGVAPDYDYGSSSVAQVDSGFQPASVSPSKKTIYVNNPDYPPVNLVSYPTRPQEQTNFMKLLDLELQKTQHLSLTENIEQADYRVNLECAGITNCTELKVFVLSPNRDVLTGFSIKNIATRFGFKRREMGSVIQELTDSLNKRISQLDQGDYGYSHY